MIADRPIADCETFLFRPRTAHTLACIRAATGGMIAYIHAIWLLDLEAFFGPNALLSNQVVQAMHAEAYKWTYLAATDALWVARSHELFSLVAGLCMCIGLCTRWSVPAAWLGTLLTIHRLAPFSFGLDQIVLMLAMYLCLGSSGDVWSLDSWLLHRNGQSAADGSQPGGSRRTAWFLGTGDSVARWNNTLSMRLIQLHLCMIYLFGGIGKLRGWMWWDGTAMWYSAAAYEYQSLPLTWIVAFPTLGSIATHVTLFWEVTYAALVWPRWTRPWVLGMAVVAHAGIALFLGMITFGFMMIVANLAFIEPVRILNWRRGSPLA